MKYISGYTVDISLDSTFNHRSLSIRFAHAASQPSYPQALVLGLGIGGYTLIELLVALSMLAIVTGIALPSFNSRRTQISTAQRVVITNLRLARASAITKSVHYQVDFPTSTQLRLSRMKPDPDPNHPGAWIVDTAVTPQTLNLPPVTLFSPSPNNAVGTRVEFNSRGMVFTNTLPVPQGAQTSQVDIRDTFGVTKSVQIWLSGQVNEL